MTLTPEQLKERKKGIGGSEVAALIGVHPSRTPMDVFLSKMDLGDDFTVTEAMQWGNLLEQVVADEYARRFNVELYEPGTITHPRFPWWKMTPDRFIRDDEERMIEIKTAGAHAKHNWGIEGTSDIPAHYITQVQWYMGGTDKKLCDVPVLFGGQELRVYTVPRDDEVIAMLQAEAEKFWKDHIEKMVAPEFDGSDAASQFLLHRFPRSPLAVMEDASDEQVDLARELDATKKAKKKFEAHAKELEQKLKATIGDARGVQHEKFRATWSTSSRTNMNGNHALNYALGDFVDALVRVGVERADATKQAQRIIDNARKEATTQKEFSVFRLTWRDDDEG